MTGDAAIRFDPTISRGTIFSIGMFILAVLVAYNRLMSHWRDETNRNALRMERIEIKLNLLWSAWRRENKVRSGDDERFFNERADS